MPIFKFDIVHTGNLTVYVLKVNIPIKWPSAIWPRIGGHLTGDDVTAGGMGAGSNH